MADEDAKLGDIHLTDLPRAAGGMGAVVSSLKHLARDSGLVRGTRALLAINQPDGFDCPGCAWPEPAAKIRHRLEFCENGAKAIAEEADNRTCGPEVFERLSISELRLLSDFELSQLGRLTHPLVVDRDGTHYRAVAWDEAIGLVAGELRLAGPAKTSFYTSGRTSNEAAFLYQLFGRMFGTNNFPDCSNMCHESTGVALRELIGVGKGTVSLTDFAHADLIFVIGQNPGTNHPRMLSTLREAALRGATIISVNPLREVGLARFAHPQNPLDVLGRSVPLASDFVQLPIGCDQAFFLGIAKVVLEQDAVDATFLADHVDGYAAYRDHVLAIPWDTVTQRAGVDRATIDRVAAKYLASNATIACWAMGLTQHKHAVPTIQEVANVLLLRGNIGRAGAGLCPVRGHSNVQGDRTMGIDHGPPPEFLERLGEVCGFSAPREHGLDSVATVEAMQAGAIRAFVSLGGNFLAAMSDTDAVRVALEQCDLVVNIATKLNRTHLHPGARGVILPCLGRSERDLQNGEEQFVTVEDSMSMVHRSRGVLPPASPELRSEPAIVAALAARTLDTTFPWAELAADYDKIRDLISLVIPGFLDFNTRVRTPDGFQLPNVGRDRTFAAIGGRAKLAISTPPDLTLPPERLRMMTIRSHDQYNTTIYGLDDRYRGVRGERRVIFMNATDMAVRHLVERQLVDITSEWTDGERVVTGFIVVPFDLPRGNCATYFPEANPLIPLTSVADRSNTPTSKSVVVRVTKAAADRAR